MWISMATTIPSRYHMSRRRSKHCTRREVRTRKSSARDSRTDVDGSFDIDRAPRSIRVIMVSTKAVMLLLAVLGSGCVAAEESDDPPDRDVSRVEWVAVLEHAESPNDRQFESRASTIADNPELELGEQLVVSPVACWVDLQEDLGLPSGSYVIAVVGSTREEAADYAEAVGYEAEPSQRPSMCQD